jgi:hypothetical protein
MSARVRRWGHVSLAGLVLAGLWFTLPAAGTAGEVTSNVDLRFWGRAVFNLNYDTAQHAVDFMSYLTDDVTSLNFNPRDTRLGFAASQQSGDWTYSSVFEIDFYGANSDNNLLPRLRLGYAEARRACGLSIRGGQDWVPIAQQNPGTVDFGIQAWSGNLWWRVPQLTVRYRGDRVEYLVGAMKHRIATDQERQEEMPWLLGRVGLFGLLGEGSLVAIGGGWRAVTVGGADYTPYLGALEFVVPFGDSGLVLNGEVYYGAGIGREFIHYGFDYNPDHPDGAREITSLGGFASLKIPVAPRVDLNLGYGLDDPDDDDLGGFDARYLKNTSLFGNVKVNVTRHFGWGLEVSHFITDRSAGELTGQRFTGSWWFIF